MAWFKVDDGFSTSPKVLSIPRGSRMAAVGLWTIAGTWCAKHLTDGHVPAFMLDEWGADLSHGTALVGAGLWVQEADGFVFHDWVDYQPSRLEVNAIREKERRRKEDYRARKAGIKGESPADVPSDSDDVSRGASGHPIPSHPDPSHPPTKERTSRGTRLSPDWMPSAESVAKMRDEASDVDTRAEHATFVDYWIAQPGQKGVKTNWESTWRNWMRRKQQDRRPVRAAVKPTKQEQVLDLLDMGQRLQAAEDQRAVGA